MRVSDETLCLAGNDGYAEREDVRLMASEMRLARKVVADLRARWPEANVLRKYDAGETSEAQPEPRNASMPDPMLKKMVDPREAGALASTPGIFASGKSSSTYGTLAALSWAITLGRSAALAAMKFFTTSLWPTDSTSVADSSAASAAAASGRPAGWPG